MYMDVSENSGTPQIIHFNRVFHYKPSILDHFGVSLFLETPICHVEHAMLPAPPEIKPTNARPKPHTSSSIIWSNSCRTRRAFPPGADESNMQLSRIWDQLTSWGKGGLSHHLPGFKKTSFRWLARFLNHQQYSSCNVFHEVVDLISDGYESNL